MVQYPRIIVRPAPPTWYAKPVLFRIERSSEDVFEQEVLYSQLTLYTLLNEFGNDFRSILDIGSHAGNVARIFSALGKDVTTCEAAPGYEADYKADYLDVPFQKKFDAIWCSQVLEHQRNVGFFLNKIFDDLNDGGILALTVPLQVDMTLAFGHCNLFSPSILIYHLVMAGFSCRDISFRIYESNIGVILRKSYNGINRNLPMGTLPLTDKTEGTVDINGKSWEIHDLLGEEVFPGMAKAFPGVYNVEHVTAWPGIDSINWPSNFPSFLAGEVAPANDANEPSVEAVNDTKPAVQDPRGGIRKLLSLFASRT